MPASVEIRHARPGLRCDVTTAGHTLTADESGGSGPSPYEFLLTALGTCKAMTLRLYADRKGWPLEGVRIRLAHDRVDAATIPGQASRTGEVDRVQVDLTLEGPLDAEQRQRLIEIADRCPVHRTLANGVHVETRPA